MALVPGSISAQEAAGQLTGEELLAINREIGPVVAATALVVGNSYRIETLGTTNWVTVGATATPAPGDEFRCDAVGIGTGTAQQIVTRRTTTQDVADLGGGGGGAGPTNITYNPASREIDSSTGTGVVLPLAGAVVEDQPVAGLQTAADAARVAQLGEEDAPTFAGLIIGGTVTATQFDGGLTGAVSSHCRNVSGASLAALTPLYVTGSQGDTTILEVVSARGDTPGRMPAAGLALAAMGTSGNAAAGHLVAAGAIAGVNTAGLTSGAPLFVALTGGTTATMPATGLVQVVAVVGRVHATTGTVIVLPGPALTLAAFTGAYGDLSGRPGEISQAEAEEGTGTVFRLWSAARWRQAAATWWQTVGSSFGRSLLSVVTAADGRTALGAEQAGAAATGIASHLAAQSHLTSSDVRQLFSATTPLAYDNSTGVFSITAAGAKNIFLSAGAFIPGQPNPCGVDGTDTSTNRRQYDVLTFSDTTQQTAEITTVFPDNSIYGTIFVRFYWEVTTNPGGGQGVVFQASAVAIGDGSSNDVAGGTPQLVADTLIGAGVRCVTAATPAITVAGSPAANKTIQIIIARVPADASDTLATPARVVGIEVLYS